MMSLTSKYCKWLWNVTLCVDIRFVNRIFVKSSSHTIKFATCDLLADQTHTRIAKIIIKPPNYFQWVLSKCTAYLNSAAISKFMKIIAAVW